MSDSTRVCCRKAKGLAWQEHFCALKSHGMGGSSTGLSSLEYTPGASSHAEHLVCICIKARSKKSVLWDPFHLFCCEVTEQR